ncbi:MAG: hypothetical protein M0R03_16870 [Novosphingobium sp.]|nr:hypothetical protein [Novosphingobium sp.]
MALPILFSLLGGSLAKAGMLGAAGSLFANPLVASALGSGLGTALETGDVKKGLMSGLGSFAGGHLGNVVGGALGNAAGQAAGQVGGEAAGAAAGAGGGIGGLLQQGMQWGQSAPGIGSMLGSQLAGGFGGMGAKGPDTGPVPDISQFQPMQRTAVMPGPEFVPGHSPEHDYQVSTPYTSNYMQRYAPRRMAGGGMIQRQVPGMGPVLLQGGGIAALDPSMEPAQDPAQEPNDREIISAAVAAIQGQHPQPEMALGAFLATFGEAALRDLVDRVESGEMGQTAAESEGQVAGPGDGMGDMVPASIDGAQDVLLSDGEYIVPADVVSGLGNGSTDAGARELDRMMDRVRQARTGRQEQAPAVPADQLVPA